MRKFFKYTAPLFLLIGASSVVLSCSTKEMLNDAKYYILSVGNGNFTYLLENNVATVLDAGFGRTKGNGDRGLYDSYIDYASEPSARANGWRWEDRKEVTDWAIEFMKKTGVQSIDSIFISHKHTDHYNGVKALTEAFDVKTINAPIQGHGLAQELPNFKGKINSDFAKTYKSNGRTFTNITAYASKDTLKEIKKFGTDPNDTSMVLRFNVNGKNVLQPGDMTDQILPDDNAFVKKLLSKNIDVLLAAHHGSGNSFSKTYFEMAEKNFDIQHIFFSGTNDENLSEDDTYWGDFSGGHPFPADSTISSIIRDFSYTYHPIKENSIHITGSGQTAGTSRSQIDYLNFNKSFVYENTLENNWKGVVKAIDDNVTNSLKNINSTKINIKNYNISFQFDAFTLNQNFIVLNSKQ